MAGPRPIRKGVYSARIIKRRLRMKWVKALFILLLASAAAAQGAVAQTVQAVTFPGSSFLRNGALPVNVSASPQGIISVWYRASNISPGTSQLLMASYDATTRRPMLLMTID